MIRPLRPLCIALTLSLAMLTATTATTQGIPVPEKGGDKSPKPKPGAEKPVKKEKGWLGVSLKTISPEASKKLGYDHPLVIIDMIFDGSPAHASNLKAGDLFVSLDGEEIKTVKQLVVTVGGHVAGDKIALVMIRDSKKFSIPILLGIKPNRVEMLKSQYLNKPAPAFALGSPKGGAQHKLADLKGKVIVVDFWATWCGPCKKAMPHLNEISTRHKKDGLVVLGITDEDKADVDTFTGKHTVAYPLALDPDRAAHRAYRISAYPTAFVIDHEGIVREVILGGGKKNLDLLDTTVARLLADRKKAMGTP